MNALEVRDEIVKCFFNAHCQDSGIDIKDDDQAKEADIKKEYCQAIIRKTFKQTGGDFENPTKESLTKLLDELAEFSKDFRDPSIINDNYQKMLDLVNKVDEIEPESSK